MFELRWEGVRLTGTGRRCRSEFLAACGEMGSVRVSGVGGNGSSAKGTRRIWFTVIKTGIWGLKKGNAVTRRRLLPVTSNAPLGITAARRTVSSLSVKNAGIKKRESPWADKFREPRIKPDAQPRTLPQQELSRSTHIFAYTSMHSFPAWTLVPG